MSEEMTRLDKYFEWVEKYPRLNKIDTWFWTHRPRLLWYKVQGWWEIRQWKPGQFFLDHGTHPMILIECEDDGALRGISLVDGHEQHSDLFHCGPVKVTEKEAKAQVPVYKQEEAFYTYEENIR